ncbi:hypothetical protein L1049_019777 [Liquidambar formosana]|uniref:Uncharacterized protein n=1 Tax=Liquidambar formosana TaxID=63359 RepID=A0AAP0SBV1_LIQFO
MPVACQAGPSTLSGSTPMHTSVPISDPCVPNDIDRCNQPDYHDRGEDHELNNVGCEETMEDAYDDDNLRREHKGNVEGYHFYGKLLEAIEGEVFLQLLLKKDVRYSYSRKTKTGKAWMMQFLDVVCLSLAVSGGN